MASKIAVSSVQEVITINDITNQILTNAEVVFPNEKDLKVVSSQVKSGLIHYTTVVGSDPKSASVHKEYKIVLNGPAGKTRRDSMMALLEETEKRVAKDILGK